MLIQTFDLASRTGFATGPAGQIPTSKAAILRRRGDAHALASYRMGAFLYEQWAFGRPDLVVVEDFMNPAGSKSADASIIALLLRGALESACGREGIRIESVSAATWRKHFCGRSSANPPARPGHPKTNKQKAADREATNLMVWRRAVMLGYFSHGDVVDFDKCNAAGLFDYASTHFGGKSAAGFRLFEQR